jgi:3-oxoacyl-[acyl-carrier protein] reductase
MDLGIGDKTALVTASSKGLGLGTARALAAEGCNVAMNARDADRVREAADALPGATLALPGDVTDPAEPGRLVEATVERFGGLDILVANAGGPPQARALDVDGFWRRWKPTC